MEMEVIKGSFWQLGFRATWIHSYHISYKWAMQFVEHLQSTVLNTILY